MRPVAQEHEGKRHSIGFRTTKAVKDRIEAEAKANGRSIAQEIEFRLEAGYEISDARKAFERSNAVVSALLGDEKTAMLLRTMAATAGAAMSYTGKHWDKDGYTRAAVQAGLDAVRGAIFKSEPLNIADPSEIDADRLDMCVRVGQLLGGLMVLSKGSAEAVRAIEELALAGDDGRASKEAAAIIVSLMDASKNNFEPKDSND